MVCGIVLALAAAGMLVVTTRTVYKRVPWYRYKPAAWVFRDADSSDPSVRQRGIVELCNRVYLHALSHANQTRLAELLLAIQAQPISPKQSEPLIETSALTQLYEAGALSEEQKARFVQNAFQATLVTRANMRPDRPLPLRLKFRTRVQIPLVVTAEVVAVRCDGADMLVTPVQWRYVSSGSAHQQDWVLPSVSTGSHRIECDLRTMIQRFDEASNRFVLAAGQETITTLATDFEVAASAPAETIRRVQSPMIDAGVRVCVQPGEFYVAPDTAPGGGLIVALHGWIKGCDRLPCDLAVDVQARWDDQLRSLGSLVMRKNYPRLGAHMEVKGPVPFDIPDHVDIELVPSDAAALNTVDVTEIWGGEIVFHDIYVKFHERLGEWQRFAAESQAATSPATQPTTQPP